MLRFFPSRPSIKPPPHRISASVLSLAVLALNLLSMPTDTQAQLILPQQEIAFVAADVCHTDRIAIPPELQTAPPGEPDELPINAAADQISARQDDPLLLLGNAQVTQGRRGIYADEITYHQKSTMAEAVGDAHLYLPNGTEIRADSITAQLDAYTGSAQNVRLRTAHARSAAAPTTGDHPVYVGMRATADSIEFTGKATERLHNTTLTTCAQGQDDVLLQARQIDLDHATGVGKAKNMTLKFMGLPIFYFPVATFPITDERKTGFLFPAAGYDNQSGLVLEVPYYLNIAPQQDATLVARLLTRRGVQLYGEYRHLSANSRSRLQAEYLPVDAVYDDQTRHAIKLDHVHRLSQNWDAGIDLQTVSDSDYLRDFNSDIDIVGSSFVAQRGKLRYTDRRLRFQLHAVGYDVVNNRLTDSDRPYEILPELSLHIKPYSLGVFKTGADVAYTNFEHADNNRVAGSRLRLKPYISLPLKPAYGYITPRLSLQTIHYSLDNPTSDDDSPSVSIPILSIDSGLYFDRQFEYRSKYYSQSLEPRLFYLDITAKQEQETFPNFDTGLGSNSSFNHFFRENRFFGGDRVGDSRQISLGLSSRIIEQESGRQRFQINLGQVFYLRDRKVGLTADSAVETGRQSDFIAEATANIKTDWRLSAFVRWDNAQSELGAIRFSADYHRNQRRAAITYTRSNGTIGAGDDDREQFNFSFATPLAEHWQFTGQAAYSIEDAELRSSGLGVNYDSCCWAVRLALQRHLNGQGEFKSRVLVILELDSLGRIGTRF